MNEWMMGLSGLTDKQIAHGIDRARDEFDWPPSISEFQSLCLDITFQDFAEEHDELTAIALKVSHIDSFSYGMMTCSQCTKWRETYYPVAANILRRKLLGGGFDQFSEGH